MAYQEYYDLYLKAQENPDAKYYVVSFDVIKSKSLSPQENDILGSNIDTIMKYVYGKLIDKEKELNRPVVIHDERFYRPWTPRTPHMLNGNYRDPSVLGDNFEFTVLRGTITKEEIISWVNACKKSLNMQEEFHIADGYYETNDFEERGTKLFRGYCLQILEKLHKPKFKKK